MVDEIAVMGGGTKYGIRPLPDVDRDVRVDICRQFHVGGVIMAKKHRIEVGTVEQSVHRGRARRIALVQLTADEYYDISQTRDNYLRFGTGEVISAKEARTLLYEKYGETVTPYAEEIE